MRPEPVELGDLGRAQGSTLGRCPTEKQQLMMFKCTTQIKTRWNGWETREGVNEQMEREVYNSHRTLLRAQEMWRRRTFFYGPLSQIFPSLSKGLDLFLGGCGAAQCFFLLKGGFPCHCCLLWVRLWVSVKTFTDTTSICLHLHGDILIVMTQYSPMPFYSIAGFEILYLVTVSRCV